MNEKIMEIYIQEEGEFVLFQTLNELREMMKEVGEFYFDFTPYCG